MASTFFFGGQQYTSPAAVSQVNDNGFAPVGATTGNNLAIVGISTGGTPDVVVACQSPTDASNAFVAGELVTAIKKAFSPSTQTPSPNQVFAISVPKLLPATLTLSDVLSAPSILLTASAYGTPGNNIKVKVETSSDGVGKRVTTQNGAASFVQDNIERPLFTLQYTGAALTASATINLTTLTLIAPLFAAAVSIDLSTTSNATDVVQRILSVPGWSASVVPGASEFPVYQSADAISYTDAKTAPITMTANLQAVVDYFNGANEGYVSAVRAPGAASALANLPFTYLTGGASPAVLLSDWSDAFTALQTADVQEVVVLSSDPAVQALADAHYQYMSSAGRHERRGWTGMAVGATIAAVSAAAKALNSDRSAIVFPGYYDYDVNGVLTLYPGYMAAVMVAAGFAGVTPGVPMTNKALTARGVEIVLRNPADTDVLIQAGVTPIESATDGYKCVRSVSTWRNNNNFNRVESSCGLAVDYVSRTVRDAMQKYRGGRAAPETLSTALEETKTILGTLSIPYPAGPGVLVGDAKSPPFLTPFGSIVGDAMRIEFQCSPVIPLNFIGVTIDIVPYSGTASA